MRKYPWEMGTKLASQIQARDWQNAEQNIVFLFNYIKSQCVNNFDELKLRIIQLLTIASRSAYNAGANPDTLFEININFLREMLIIKDCKELLSLSKSTIKNLVSTVPEKNISDMSKIGEAIEYIRNNCTSNVSREIVSKILSCSPSHLSRLFSELTGHTFKEFVLKYRMEKAKELLCNTKLNITEVAYEVGYNDPNYFTSVFRRTIGITPSQYKKTIPANLPEFTL